MSKLDDLISRFLDKRNGWVLLACVAGLVFLVWAGSAHAGTSFYAKDERGNTITLRDEPCKSPELLAKANEQLRTQVKDATLVYQGRTLRACWVLVQTNVHLIDEEFDVTVISVVHFRPVENV